MIQFDVIKKYLGILSFIFFAAILYLFDGYGVDDYLLIISAVAVPYIYMACLENKRMSKPAICSLIGLGILQICIVLLLIIYKEIDFRNKGFLAIVIAQILFVFDYLFIKCAKKIFP